MIMSEINADLLRTERIQFGWTQAEVAKALGISVKTVRRWEQGLCVPYPYYQRQLSILKAMVSLWARLIFIAD